MFVLRKLTFFLLPALTFACTGESTGTPGGEQASADGAPAPGGVALQEEAQNRKAMAIELHGNTAPQLREVSSLSQEQLKEEHVALAQESLEVKTRGTAETLNLSGSVADGMVEALLADLEAQNRVLEYCESHGRIMMMEMVELGEAGDATITALLEDANPVHLEEALHGVMGGEDYSRYVALRQSSLDSNPTAPSTIQTINQ